MQTLATGRTLGGQAATPAVVNYFVHGNAVTGTTPAFDILAMGQLPSSATTLLTVSATFDQVGEIQLFNTSVSAVACKFFLAGLGGANQWTAVTVPGLGSAIYNGKGWTIYDSTGASVPLVLTLTGAVTGSGSTSIATTLAANIVANSNLAQMGQATFKMRAAGAGTGDPIDGTPAQAKTALAIVPGDVTGFDTQVRTSRLDQMATPTADVSMGGFKLTTLADATNATDAVTFQQLQAVAEGRDDKEAVLWSTTGNVTLSGLGTQANGEWTGTLTAGDRILAKDQSSSPTKGIWLAAAGAWTRALDANTGAEITNATVLIQAGATLKGDTWRQSATVATIGTDPQTWVQIGEGDPITLTAVGAVPNAQGASLSGQALTLQPASGAFPGLLSAAGFTTLSNQSGVNTGDQTITLTGNVTGSGTGSFVATIALNAVTNAKLAQMPAHTFKGNNTGSTADPLDLTIAQMKSELSLTGTNSGDQTITLTGDVTGSGTGSFAATLASIITAGGPTGAANTVPVITWDVKGRLTAVTTATVTPAAIGAPAGSGTSTGSNTGDQTISLTGDATAAGGTGALTVSVIKLQGTAVSATVPTVGMNLRFGPTSWQPTQHEWNVVNFGADPAITGDSTLAIYNAHIACGITPGAAFLVTSGTPTTATTNFNITIPTPNAAFPAAGTGTLIAMTTRGLVYMTFTGGTSGTVVAAVTAGVAGGTILAGSIMGIVSTTQIGGTVYYPEGIYQTTQPVINSIPNVWERGPSGGSSNSDVGNWGYSGGAWLYYNGTSLGDFIMTHVPVTGTLGLQGGQALKGIKVTGLSFACSGPTFGYGQANGLRLISCNSWHLEDLFVNEPAFVSYEFTTLGLNMLGEAEDTTRGTAINLRFRCLEKPSGATAAQVSAAATAITAGVGTNINTFAGAGTISTAALTAAAWPTSIGGKGLAMVQAIDQLTGNVMDYMVTYTGVAGPGLTGVETLPLFWNQANATSLVAATPSTSNPKPSALLFTGALVRPAYAAYGMGFRLHGSATANSSVNTMIQCGGNHWMNAAAYLGNSDTNRFIGFTFNRTTAGTPTGLGWDVQGATSILGAAACSRNNRWYGGDAGPGGATFRGTNSYGYTNTPAASAWWDYELGNGAPAPVRGTGVGDGLAVTFNGAHAPGSYGAIAAAAQVLTAATRTVLTGTSLQLLPQGLQPGWTRFKFPLMVTKTTAVGTVAWTAIVAIGAANTNADTAVATFTSGVNTTVVDMWEGSIYVDVLTIGAAATFQCVAIGTNQATAVTGMGQLTYAPGATATKDTTTMSAVPLFIHIDITSGTGAAFTAAGTVEVIR